MGKGPRQNLVDYANGTKEWASLLSIQTGCQNDCRYCYAKYMAVRFKRAGADSWKSPVLTFKTLKKCRNRYRGTIMFPSTHDITPENIDTCLAALKNLLESGNSLLIVSKPRLDCIKKLCAELEPHKANILFKFTMGSADDDILRYWEPGAPCFEERLLALVHAHGLGYATSVSIEPMLDINPGAVIDAVRPYVTDKIWLGKANSLRQKINLNCPGDKDVRKRVSALVKEQDDVYIRRLYMTYKGDPLIAWKDSIKKVVGVQIDTVEGLEG